MSRTGYPFFILLLILGLQAVFSGAAGSDSRSRPRVVVGDDDRDNGPSSRTYGGGVAVILESLTPILTDIGLKPIKTHRPKPPAQPPSGYEIPSEPVREVPHDHGHQPVEGSIYSQPSEVKPVKPSHQTRPSVSYGEESKPSNHPTKPHHPPVSETGFASGPVYGAKPPKSVYDSARPVETVDPDTVEAPYPMSPVKPARPGYEEGQEAHGCICVPYYQCDNGRVVDDGTGIIDPRMKDVPKKELALDEHYEPPYCGTFHVCCSEPYTVTKLPYTHKCGIRNPSGINRRILTPSGKGEADFGEWPWQAAVLRIEGEVNVFQCGGTLIDSQHVLTVAHCVQNFIDSRQHELKVRLGEWDTQKTTEFLPHEDYQVSQVIMHPKFNPNNLWNDIALLKLASPVTFKPNIESVCLPGPDENFDGQQCVTTGWGKNAYKGGQYSNILKEVNLPVVPHHECQKTLRRTRLGPRFRLHESFMCAGGEEGRDSCKGDGGGPLVCYREDGTYTLVGVVSWGIDCGQPGHPGVYIKIQKFLEWISEVTRSDVKNYLSPAVNQGGQLPHPPSPEPSNPSHYKPPSPPVNNHGSAGY